MNAGEDEVDRDYLRRLPAEFYRGQAYVHWSMAIDERKKGWLVPTFYCKFRELLTHAMFRYGLCCPIYCYMPDHLHLLWIGILDSSGQRNGVKYFRKQLNPILHKLDARFQKQPYDHVLREEERAKDAFETVVEYIARNPKRAGLVKPDCPTIGSASGGFMPMCGRTVSFNSKMTTDGRPHNGTLVSSATSIPV